MSTSHQHTLYGEPLGQFPPTRYQGSKAKLVDWIWEQISDLKFETCLDVFGGTGAVAYKFKKKNKKITYNDILKFNCLIGKALIENSNVYISPEEIDWIITRHEENDYPNFIQDMFKDIYFTDEENAWLDYVTTNIYTITNVYKQALAFFALFQACIIKRPYNLFHRKNLYIRLADVDRSFGNKITWDKPFDGLFIKFINEANNAVFSNLLTNQAINYDAMEIPDKYDLTYIDTPYISADGSSLDYHWYYHFLEGLTMYNKWDEHIDKSSKHHRLKIKRSVWTDKNNIINAFDKLFQHFKDSILVVSYRSDGIPSENELVSLMKKYKNVVRVEYFGQYKYVLSNNSESKELLLIGV